MSPRLFLHIRLFPSQSTHPGVWREIPAPRLVPAIREETSSEGAEAARGATTVVDEIVEIDDDESAAAAGLLDAPLLVAVVAIAATGLTTGVERRILVGGTRKKLERAEKRKKRERDTGREKEKRLEVKKSETIETAPSLSFPFSFQPRPVFFRFDFFLLCL